MANFTTNASSTGVAQWFETIVMSPPVITASTITTVNSDDTLTVWQGNFTQNAAGEITGGTLTGVDHLSADGSVVLTTVTGISIPAVPFFDEVTFGGLVYNISWFNLIETEVPPIQTPTSTLIVLGNIDGTQTHIIGTDFVLDPNSPIPLGGIVTALAHHDANGVLLETISMPNVSLIELATYMEKGPIEIAFTQVLSGDDVVVGNDGDADSFYFGGAGNDTITTSAADDHLGGHTGNDTLTGNGGVDTFHYTYYGDVQTEGFGDDVITDFTIGVDKIDISDFPSVSTFSDLEITTNGNGDAVITIRETVTSPPYGTITLTGVPAANLSPADFQIFDANGGGAGQGSELSVSNTQGTEGDTLVFTITLSEPATDVVTVDYTTNDLTATGGVDYTPTFGTAIFAIGETEYFVYVNTLQDTNVENPDEDFQLLLSNAQNANIGVAYQAAGTILDDGDENSPIIGTEGIDFLYGTAGDDDISGLGGDDFIQGSAGNDSIDGGAGDDIMNYIQDTQGVSVHLGLNTATGAAIGTDSLTSIEDVWGGDGNDSIVGNAANNSIQGNGGNDILQGRDGNDSLNGGAGDDILLGQNGNDNLDGGEGDDQLFGQSGIDTLSGNAGNDTLSGGLDNDFLDGGLGDDIVLGGGGNDTMNGNEGADILSGGSGNDTMYGDDGNDLIVGGGGEDIMYGGLGDDVMSGGSGNDLVIGDDGIDQIFGAAGNDTLNGGLGNDTLSGGAGDDTVEGDAGDDLVLGGSGIDILSGGDGTDTLSGGSEADALHGGAGTDTLLGGSGDDWLTGDAGNDLLFGGTGHDLLDGGDGNDYLNGQGGNDTFVFAGIFGNDTIVGFEAGNALEQIDLSNALFTGTIATPDFATLMADYTTFDGTHTTITIGIDTIKLNNVDIADLTADDFIL